MAYHNPTPAYKRTSSILSPPPEAFDPTLTPLKVYERVWDLFYVGLDPCATHEGEDENDDREGISRGGSGNEKKGWDTQACAVYLNELCVDMGEYWKRSAEILPLPIGENFVDEPSPSSFSSFTFESFSSSVSATTNPNPPAPTRIPDAVPFNIDESKYGPHAPYIACTPISENIVSPLLEQSRFRALAMMPSGGYAGAHAMSIPGPSKAFEARPRVEFVPFADDERFHIIAEQKTGTLSNEERRRRLTGVGTMDDSGDSAMDVDGEMTMDPSSGEHDMSQHPGRHRSFFLPSAKQGDKGDGGGKADETDTDDDDDEEEEEDDDNGGYLDCTWGTREKGYLDIVPWTWMNSGDDPDYESIQLETARRLHHQYNLSFDDIATALPGFGRVMVNEMFGAIFIDHSAQNLSVGAKSRLGWLTPRDDFSWTGALPESVVPPLTVAYVKELFSVREVPFEDEGPSTNSESDTDEELDASEREGFEAESETGAAGWCFQRATRGGEERINKRGAKSKGKERLFANGGLTDDGDQGRLDGSQGNNQSKSLEVTQRTLFDELCHTSGIWCSNVECMRVWRGGCIVHQIPRIKARYPKVPSKEYPSFLDEDVPPYIYSPKEKERSKMCRKGKGKALGNTAEEPDGEPEECGVWCFRSRIWSKRDMDQADLVWPSDSLDLHTLKGVLQVDPDALPCHLAGIVRKKCIEVFVNRLRLYPDKDIEKNFVIDEYEGKKDPRDIKRLNDYRTLGSQNDPYPTQVPCSHPGACHIRFKGCRCGKPKSKESAKCCNAFKCPCRIELRECDPELCRCCVKGTKKKSESVCDNRKLQKGEFPVILIGKTTWGQGAFTTTTIPKGTPLGEYVGEIDYVNDHAGLRDRLLKFYDLNYAFGYTTKYLLDSKMVGNETRYLNHDSSSKGQNVTAELVTVNNTYKVVLRTTKRVKPMSELFLDYGEQYWEGKGGDPVKGKEKRGGSGGRMTEAASKRGGQTADSGAGGGRARRGQSLENGQEARVLVKRGAKKKATRRVVDFSEEDWDRMDEASTNPTKKHSGCRSPWMDDKPCEMGSSSLKASDMGVSKSGTWPPFTRACTAARVFNPLPNDPPVILIYMLRAFPAGVGLWEVLSEELETSVDARSESRFAVSTSDLVQLDEAKLILVCEWETKGQ
ncbi:hypothetical protein BKA70DRAFT_1490303 [Coprinopsis sp. MPI-PUGE-AT-0042]|nr:hypothetical protein BKA70DRAFT_1490303 [Coprinopsis sp. MPI-PUGE-AT-0042]